MYTPVETGAPLLTTLCTLSLTLISAAESVSPGCAGGVGSMGQWLIVDTLLRRAGACGSRPTQAVKEAGTPCERVGRIAPSKLESGIMNPEDWESRQRGRGARGAGRGAWRGDDGRKVEGARRKVQGARLSGMWNVECGM